MSDEITEPKFVFCSGRCGSKYLAWVLRELGVEAVHEPEPDLWCEHVARAVHATPGNRPRERVDSTRPTVDVEVNNRLSFLAHDVMSVFGDDALYAHLHRNPWDSVTSQMRNSRNVKLDTIYGGVNQFQGACYWWARTNRATIMAAQRNNVDLVNVPFHRLVNGEAAGALSEIKGSNVSDYPTQPRNETSPRRETRFPSPGEWTSEQHETLWKVASAVAEELGYEESEHDGSTS